ncbi:MAG: dephospho-CoA kinase [Candidatus Symbiothrix sp.]|jgi:dephospho-CoA kinase|nr:dephospho-CoA kinase [Candidatus Symbiothrix sp.]
MKVLGITGGIGSGKSIVSKLLEINGIPVYNTDIAAKILYNISPVIRQKLTERFGAELYAEGVLNRSLLASRIFQSSEDLRFVNSIVHPKVENDLDEWKNQFPEKSVVGVESAILFESNLCNKVDIIINVSSCYEIRVERVQQRDKLSKEEIDRRIQQQMDDASRCRLANFTIINDNRQALLPQIENLLKRLK